MGLIIHTVTLQSTTCHNHKTTQMGLLQQESRFQTLRQARQISRFTIWMYNQTGSRQSGLKTDRGTILTLTSHTILDLLPQAHSLVLQSGMRLGTRLGLGTILYHMTGCTTS